MGTTGAVVGLGYLGSNSVSATTDVDQTRIDALKNTKPVQEIVNEFGSLDIGYETARMQVIEDEESKYEVVHLETNLGKLEYYERDGESEMAQLRLTDPESDRSFDQVRGRLPEQYRYLPETSHTVFLAGEGGKGLFRSPTENERTRLEQVVDGGVDDALVFISDTSDGFQVIRHDDSTEETVVKRVLPETKRADPTVRNDLDPAYAAVEPDGFANADVVTKSPDEIQVQGSRSDCITWCGTCVTGSAVCVRCAIACAGSVTGIGAVACAVCLVASCSAGGYACTQCYDDCQSFV